jgi:hypothetical protein
MTFLARTAVGSEVTGFGVLRIVILGYRSDRANISVRRGEELRLTRFLPWRRSPATSSVFVVFVFFFVFRTRVQLELQGTPGKAARGPSRGASLGTRVFNGNNALTPRLAWAEREFGLSRNTLVGATLLIAITVFVRLVVVVLVICGRDANTRRARSVLQNLDAI